jgi:hypothetical protein
MMNGEISEISPFVIDTIVADAYGSAAVPDTP